MVSDSITGASIHAASSLKDFGRKKRTNRSAKLKQCKLDARREQWLSQVKNKGCKEESDGGVGGGTHVPHMHVRNGRDNSFGNFEMNPRGEENDGSIHHDSDSESPSNSPTSSSSVLSSKNSVMNYSGSSASSSSGGSFSGNISEEEREDGCLDDWEAVADALAIKDKQHSPGSETRTGNQPVGQLESQFPCESNRAVSGAHKPKQECGATVQRSSTVGRAWRPDDAFRPQCLPNLSKQRSFPMNSDRHYCRRAMPCTCNSVIAAPLSCPICYEDLDFTDSNFLPCSCGFRICLFCHKRIIEEDGRCPGCRKQYHHDPVEGEATLSGGSLTFRLTRSCSMITRS
ncbi:uncharacterized protein LOC131145976 [Malania oleifera]|uniref:uncharacterized protein LOC131145976 n=1 Tax=Malania oleifera TaxID=397392 RepID=UPI0025AE5FC4|nr:uncharacterized protein LOC131145976 [Malania oleifera]